MLLKTNLHFHSGEDRRDNISYSAFEGIDRAAGLGFDVLAITCHDEIVVTERMKEYAKNKEVLLISGAELRIEGADVVALGTEDKSIENLKSFNELRKYKQKNPGVFIMAPHPFYVFGSLGGRLEKNIDIFDAVEHSWFYFLKSELSPNFFAKRVAEKNNLPFLATSDTHNLDFLDIGYAVVDAEEKTAESVFGAIKKGNFENFSVSPKLSDIIGFLRDLSLEKPKIPEFNEQNIGDFWQREL